MRKEDVHVNSSKDSRFRANDVENITSILVTSLFVKSRCYRKAALS